MLGSSSADPSDDQVQMLAPTISDAGRQIRNLRILVGSVAAVALIAVGSVATLLIARPGPTTSTSVAAFTFQSATPIDAVSAARRIACGRLTAPFQLSQRSPGQWRSALSDNSNYVMKAATDGVFAAQLATLFKAYQDSDAIDRAVDEAGYENAAFYVFGDFKAVADTCQAVGVIFTAGAASSTVFSWTSSTVPSTRGPSLSVGKQPIPNPGPSSTAPYSSTTKSVAPSITESAVPNSLPSPTVPPSPEGANGTGSAGSVIHCDSQVILVMNKTGLAEAIYQDPEGTLATYPRPAKLGTYASDCINPGKKVIFFGPYKTQRAAWEKRRALRTGRADVVLLSVTETAREPGGICELAQTAKPPTLSIDPTVGVSSGPWVFELTNVLIRRSLLPFSESDQSDLSPIMIQAIKQYQKLIGAVADGEVDPTTWANILAYNCSN